MNQRWIAAITLVIAILGMCDVFAISFYDGKRLFDWANAHDRADAKTATELDYVDAAKLQAYVAAIAETLDEKEFCIPKNVSLGQLVAISKKFLRERPHLWNERGDVLVATAFLSVYPCSARK